MVGGGVGLSLPDSLTFTYAQLNDCSARPKGMAAAISQDARISRKDESFPRRLALLKGNNAVSTNKQPPVVLKLDTVPG